MSTPGCSQCSAPSAMPPECVQSECRHAAHGGAQPSCAPPAPLLSRRNAEAIAQAISAHRAGYTPTWRSPRGAGDAGVAVNDILARFMEIQGQGLNAMPQRLQLEFLEAMGANVLPPQPARAPLVFKLLDTATGDATVAQGTRVGAVLPPPAPSLVNDATPQRAVAPEFFTEQEFTAMRGRLAALYSIDPQADAYADHTAAAASGFTVFDAMQPVPHRLYLAHGELFKLAGSAEIVLSFDFATARAGDAGSPQRPLLIDWEYLSNDGWQPLTLVDDGTERFTRDGKVTLAKFFGPDSKEDTVGGHSSHWIRGTVASRTPSARIAGEPTCQLHYTDALPEDRKSVSPPGYWLHYVLADVTQPIATGNSVMVGGQVALVLAVSRDRLVVDTKLPAANAGADIFNGGGTALCGQVLGGAYALASVDAACGVDGGCGCDGGAAVLSQAVLSQASTELLTASFPQGAARGAPLYAGNGDFLGTIDAPVFFRVPVESTRDLYPGDVVTIDGITRATIRQTAAAALFFADTLPGAQPGLSVVLADALPPLRPEGADAEGALPLVDLIRARVGFGKSDLPLDSAYIDRASIDISKDFYPFGEQPTRFATFYASCKEAFTRNGARVELALRFNQAGLDKSRSTDPAVTATPPAKVLAEFFNGSRWEALGPEEDYVDATASLTLPQVGDPAFPHGKISFTVPSGWEETEVNSEKGRWLRLRISAGDYGKPLSVDVVPDTAHPGGWVVQSTPATLQPPIVGHLGVSYFFFTNPQSPDFCVTENDFAFAEHSEDARWPRSPFAPFEPVSDRTPALHLGFSSQPPSALISLLAHIAVPAADGDPQPYAWDYWGSRGWTELSVRDTTLGLRQTGLIQFVGAPDALPREGLGGALYRIRARLKAGLQSQNQIVQSGGLWLNAAWGRQGQAISRDGLGTSNGNPDQSFALPIARALKTAAVAGVDTVALDAASFERALDTALAGVPILGDELLEVREWAGRGDDWQTTLGNVDAADLRFEVDPQDPTVKTAAWVRWHAQPHFYRSGPNDRHYVVERARGVFRFPGANGLIPPAGATIVVSYVTGGGVDGNVPAGAVRELRSGVGFVQSVSNPLPAGGGAAAELLRGARDRSLQLPRHRDRAVSFEDYQWLAMGASSEVARVRALPLEGPPGRGARGSVGLVLVPHSGDARPQASPELARSVLAAVALRMPAGVAGGLRIVDASYVAVGVRAEILALRADEAGRVEAQVRARLQAFLHPLSGGREGRGWGFGQSAYLCDLAALIEDTPGVDAVRFLQLMVGQAVYGDEVPVGADQLVAAGDSQLKILVPSLSYATA